MRSEIKPECAQELILQTQPIAGEQALPLADAHGRVLARDIFAEIDQPPFDRSPLDGYALRSEDTAGACENTPVTLEVADKIYAGDVPRRDVGKGRAARIMTGAMLPAGCDCVIRQEETDMGEDFVRIFRPVRRHENFCFAGEDFEAGSLLLGAGAKLCAAAVGVLASAGVTRVLVRPAPRVALLVTGDELIRPGKALPAGKIYGSNLALLTARLCELGIPPVSAVQIGDDPRIAADLIRQTLAAADVMITTGGVSVGERDLFHEVIPLLGAQQIFHGVNMKPGTPAMFSLVDGKPMLSLSGNPFAAAATFELLGRPLLAALGGDTSLMPQKVLATLVTPFEKLSPGRRFVRARLEDRRVTLPQGHSSGQLHSLAGCNCLVEIPPDTALREGDAVTVYLM